MAVATDCLCHGRIRRCIHGVAVLCADSGARQRQNDSDDERTRPYKPQRELSGSIARHTTNIPNVDWALIGARASTSYAEGMTEHDGTRRPLTSRLCLLAITVLLTGLAVTAGVQCSDGMTMPLAPTSVASHGSAAVSMPDTDSSTVPVVSHDAGIALTAGAVGVAALAADGSLPMTPGMLLGTCMALLAMALLVVAVTFRRSRAGMLLPVVAALPTIAPPLGTPNLARLCVLRT